MPSSLGRWWSNKSGFPGVGYSVRKVDRSPLEMMEKDKVDGQLFDRYITEKKNIF
jgi:hypothetical protein